MSEQMTGQTHEMPLRLELSQKQGFQAYSVEFAKGLGVSITSAVTTPSNSHPISTKGLLGLLMKYNTYRGSVGQHQKWL